MVLKDLLVENKPIKEIELRTDSPYGGDMFFGFCSWDGKSLIPLDGDSYYLDEHIQGYEFDGDDYLVVWIYSTWSI